MTASRLLLSPDSASGRHAIATATPAADGKLHRLMACPFFRSLDETARRRLAECTRRWRLSAGTAIFHMGSDGRSMMIVLAGIVRITLPSAQGRQIVLADLPAGEIFGEISLFDGGGRSADATALTNCDLAVLERRDMLLFLQQHPHAGLMLLEVICRRLRTSDERMTDVLFSASPVRLAKVLLHRAVQFGGQAANNCGVRVALSQRELGSMAGVRRERVNRCLQEWQRQGIVRIKEGSVHILDLAMLKEIAETG